MNKQQIYNRIAKATIKALREQAESGQVNSMTTDLVYQAIDQAFQTEYAQLVEQNQRFREVLEQLSNSGELSIEDMQDIAKSSLQADSKKH
ncbi:hypothetical protein HF888_11365 [Bermanella marisrubri]|uniref:Uncharacterized protein n=1 Tax=Bermanella marisrubri TaxID=207949 RepID=Q1N174_9GAMM|nr:hypothetical protein [Bermanella marisrubri]EAT11977.1 hypothetical protein RED65_11570 [Oceanobacter sp. RED65] [Bermanella marisrubri]QIZ84781.1 hypothetical protein HF888_11365 [Bermanella marisrubri]